MSDAAKELARLVLLVEREELADAEEDVEVVELPSDTWGRIVELATLVAEGR